MRAIVLSCAVFASACSGAVPVPNLGTAESGPRTEVLLVPPYPGGAPWIEITNRKDARGGTYIEKIPPGQTKSDIQDILVQQTFYGTNDSPAAFVRKIFSGARSACERVATNGPKEGFVDGFSIAYGQLYCVNQAGVAKDVDVHIKVIRGNDALYVVQREFRRTAIPGANPGVVVFGKDEIEQGKAYMQAMATANEFLVNGVRLCPLGVASGPCAQVAGENTTTVPDSVR